MGLFKKYVSQTRKPEGLLGKMMINGMNGGHAKMAAWGMSHLKKTEPEEIVDIGCGGGRNASEIILPPLLPLEHGKPVVDVLSYDGEQFSAYRVFLHLFVVAFLGYKAKAGFQFEIFLS